MNHGSDIPGMSINFYGKDHQLQTDTDLERLLGSDRFVSLKQVHGNTAVILRQLSHREVEADAVFTDVPNLILTIRAADCQQLLFICENPRVIGAVHAGWKGLKADIIQSSIDVLRKEWGIDPANVTIIAGPSVCTECAEFSNPTTELAGLNPFHFHGRNANLRAIADEQLVQGGILKENIDRHPDCTKCRNDIYWTYRGGDKEKVLEGFCNVMTATIVTG